MRFITEFENDGTKYDDALTEQRKEWRQNELGKLIANAFGWTERRPTILTNPDAERYTIEIEAFPMDKWIEFKNKLLELIQVAALHGIPISPIKTLELIKELESFGKPDLPSQSTLTGTISGIDNP